MYYFLLFLPVKLVSVDSRNVWNPCLVTIIDHGAIRFCIRERQVSVKLPGDKTIQLSVTHTDTVGQLKEKLEHQIRPPTYGSVEDSTQVVIFIK